MAPCALVRMTIFWLLSPALVVTIGCARTGPALTTASPRAAARGLEDIELVTYQLAEPEELDVRDDTAAPLTVPDGQGEFHAPPPAELALPELIAQAAAANPRLRRMEQETAAAWARVPQVRALPDPMVGANVFGRPMMMGQMQQRGSFMVSQMIPWLGRLDAESRQTAFEALALEQTWKAERLRVIADVKAAYFRLYVLGRQIEISAANQDLLESLLEVATARVATGEATQGDVLLASLEYSRIEEELLMLRQELVSTQASLNELLNRPSDTPVAIPERLDVVFDPPPLETLRHLAADYQPEIAAASLRAQATAWGIRVAELRRKPDVTLNYERMFMEPLPMAMNGMAGGGGRMKDPWLVGATVNVPLWHGRYAAIEAEATRQHVAAHIGIEEVVRRYDALLLDLLQQARTAQATAELYLETILPQARRTFEANQEAYAQGVVEFDRLIGDFRNLLTLEVAWHRAQGQLATALARLEQAAGTELTFAPVPLDVLPPVPSEAADTRPDEVPDPDDETF